MAGTDCPFGGLLCRFDGYSPLPASVSGVFSGFLLSQQVPLCKAEYLTISKAKCMGMKRFLARLALVCTGAFSVFSLSAPTLAVGADLRMIGLAVHQETGREIYIGAIHIDKLVPRPDDLIGGSGPKLMEYRVVARRTSIRSLLGTMLLQGELASGEAPTAEVSDFAAMIMATIKGSLYAGDALELLLTNDDQTIALLNGLEFARTDNGYVFDYLLGGWVEERGPGTAFRSSLLAANIDPSLLAAYQAHEWSPERRGQVAAWLAPVAEKEPAIAAPPEAVDTHIATAAATAATVALVDDAAASADIPQPESAIAMPELSLAEDPAEELVKGASEEAPMEPVQLALAAPASAPIIEPQLPDIARLDVVEYSRRLASFNNIVLRMVTEKIRYPKAAVRRNLQGNLELDLTLLDDGSLRAINVGRSSGFDTLDEAAIRAARKAFKSRGLDTIDPVARAEYEDDSGQLIVPVPVNFMLME
jgi:TonB family protein